MTVGLAPMTAIVGAMDLSSRGCLTTGSFATSSDRSQAAPRLLLSRGCDTLPGRASIACKVCRADADLWANGNP
jgi:hypothetical protein